MRRQVWITRTDAIDRIFPLEEGRTETFTLPKLKGGLFLRVFDSPAREREYREDQGSRWPGDFLIRRMERGEGAEEQVRIEAVASGGLAGADRIYVVTRGNQWQDSAAEEFYEEGQDG